MSTEVLGVEYWLVMLLSNVGDRSFDVHFDPRSGLGPAWVVYVRPSRDEPGFRRCVAHGTGPTLSAAVESVLASLKP